MGGYGTPIGETRGYRVYLHVNCSSEYRQFHFRVERKSDSQGIIYSETYGEDDHPDLEKFNQELQKDFTIFYIQDKGIRDKVEFEVRFQEMEKENIKLKETNASLRQKIEDIKKLI